MLHDTGDGTILNISRRSRRASAAIRRLAENEAGRPSKPLRDLWQRWPLVRRFRPVARPRPDAGSWSGPGVSQVPVKWTFVPAPAMTPLDAVPGVEGRRGDQFRSLPGPKTVDMYPEMGRRSGKRANFLSTWPGKSPTRARTSGYDYRTLTVTLTTVPALTLKLRPTACLRQHRSCLHHETLQFRRVRMFYVPPGTARN